MLSIGLVILMAASLSAASPRERVIDSSSSHRIIDCEPGSVPETSIIDKTENDIVRILDPDSYRQKYPGKCSIWTKTSTVEGNSHHTYQVEVMKYVGDDWDALITVKKDGEGLAYRGVDINGEDAGATDADGRLKVELPDDGRFNVSVEASGGNIEIEGAAR